VVAAAARWVRLQRGAGGDDAVGLVATRWGEPRSSAVVPKVTLWFLMGDTMATQYDKVSPESRAGRLNVSQTVAPREHFSGGYAPGCACIWHNVHKLFTTDSGHMFQYYLADADLLIQFSANQRLTRDQPY